MLKVAGGVTGGTTGQLTYAGTWNATSNSPTLTSGVGTLNNYYVVNVAGTTTLDGISNWQVGDWAIFNGSVWERIDGGAYGTVSQVNTGTGLTGGPITTTGTVSLANTTVTAGSYGSANTVPNYTVNAQGQLTAAANTSIAIDASQITSGILPINRGGTNSQATPTAGAVAYGNGTSYNFTSAGTAGQFLQSTGAGTPTWSTPSSGSFQPAYYGTFVSTSNQANGGATTANPVAFDTAAISNGISITSGNQITFANAGIYEISYELAFINSTGSNPTITTWFAQQGTNIPNSLCDFVLQGGANQPQIINQTFIVSVTAGQYIQIYWACASTTTSLTYQAALTNPTRPASPSAILNAVFVPPSGQNLVINSSTITNGTSGNILYDNGGLVGEKPVSGTGNVVLTANATVSNVTISSVASTFPNSYLTNSNVIINGTTINLGGSGTITANTTGTLTLGTGLTGTSFNGSTNVTANLANTTVTAGSYGNASTVATFTVNAQGQLTAAANSAIAIANTQVSGLGTMSTQNSNNVSITGGSINVQATNLVSTTSSTATFATSSLPLVPAGYIQVDLNGTVVKVPYYAV